MCVCVLKVDEANSELLTYFQIQRFGSTSSDVIISNTSRVSIKNSTSTEGNAGPLHLRFFFHVM